MRKFKFLIILAISLFFFFPATDIFAGECTVPSACKIGDLCQWAPSGGDACGKTSLYATCQEKGAGSKNYCIINLGKSCQSTEIDLCGGDLKCVNGKCSVKIDCSSTKPCTSGLVCGTSGYCVDADSTDGKDSKELERIALVCLKVSDCKKVISYTSPQVIANLSDNEQSEGLENYEKAILHKFKTEIGKGEIFMCRVPEKYKEGEKNTELVCKKTIAPDTTWSYSCYYDERRVTESCPEGTAVLPGFSSSSSSTTSTSTSAMYQGQAAATFGEGNFQCGTRKVTCNKDDRKGSWMENLSNECACCGSCTPDDILVVANKALEWLFGIVGALGLLMFVYGGAMWVMSRGDGGMITKGRTALVNTAIGMVIMFASSAIIVALQTSIGINSDIQVTPTGSYDYDATASKAAAKADTSIKYGEIKLGAACKVLKSSKATQCAEGMYCYSKNSSTGICLPRTAKATLDGGADCWVLPGGKTMCKSGNCDVTGKTKPEEGEKGKCETKKEVGVICMRLEGAKSQCNVGLACYNKSGKVNEEGMCLPTSKSPLIKSVEGGGVCYKLKGSLTMCASGTCQTAKDSVIGTAGECEVKGDLGDMCTRLAGKGSECNKGLECYNKGRKVDVEGICLPVSGSPFIKSLEEGRDCYKLEDMTMCKAGICVTDNDSAVGTIGSCGSKTVKEYGESCTDKTDCKDGGTCTNKICLPADGRNIAYGESCYVIPGASTNDCNSDFKCIPTAQQSTFDDENRPTGSVGRCLAYKTLSDGAFVNYVYECINGQELYSYGGSNFCVKKDFRDELKEEGMTCTSISLEGLSTTIHDCEATNADNKDLSCIYGTCLDPDAQD